MKALLMHRDRDFDVDGDLPWNEHALTQDLELEVLCRAMSNGDPFLFDIARRALLSSVSADVATVLYRQGILKDCQRHPGVVRELYGIAVEAIERARKRSFGIFSHFPSTILHESIELLQAFIELLRRLRAIAEAQAAGCQSEGLRALFAMFESELADDYLARIETHLKELKFRGGVLISAELGHGNQGVNYVLRKAGGKPGWVKRLLGKGPPSYTFYLADGDEAGARTLSELRDRGINLVANAVAQSADHITSFFEMLRAELAFYIGCLNLEGVLASKGARTCLPRPEPAGERKLRFHGLCDVCLALSMKEAVVSNAAQLDGKSIAIVTGANQGGKSSFLRSVGLAQLMMQSGMFVGAQSFTGELCTALFTHYRREEDATMKSGKLDEELARMSEIADHLVPNAMLLCNESLAATNEREGSEIARQIISAMLERRVKVFFVTHLYEFAHGLFEKGMESTVFLRAERQHDGRRTFRMVEGEPLETSYGRDWYEKVFGVEVAGGEPAQGPRSLRAGAADEPDLRNDET